MFCNQCGKEIKADDKFCQNCGVSTNESITKEVIEKIRPDSPTGWRRIKYILASFFLLAISFSWLYEISSGDSSEKVWGVTVMVAFGLWGAALLARAFGRTLSGILKTFFEFKTIKMTGGIVKKLLKFAFWLVLTILGIWLIVALGPLWIIAIILLFILFVLFTR